jgi:hypothetical protein
MIVSTQAATGGYQELWSQWMSLWNGDYSVAEEIVAPGIRVHLARHDMPDPETIKDGFAVARWIAAFRSSYSRAQLETEIGPLFSDDYIVGRWIFRGVWQSGKPERATATPGTTVTFHGIDILQIADGKIIKYWLSDDWLDLYADLGALT